MGWLFKPGSTRRELIEERTNGWERKAPDGMTVRSQCLAHCYRGGVFSGVLWTVWERTFKEDGEQVQPTERWIGCGLLQYSRSDEGWGYKDMEEASGPYYFSCPLGYLRMVPEVANEQWRQEVREHHARRREQQQARRKAKVKA